MFGTLQAWFVVETSSMTHDVTLNGISLSIFGHTTERSIQRRAMHQYRNSLIGSCKHQVTG
ncbi:hypothetical protein BRE01_28710 [Brevibacillus reuszeri]|uniref:Uncharacterized protein n=1 Tax=Brevibacillus reuszeri TaxID=54915 RepID=A0ABQ0TMQ2_9BACL|nr:hypothetical protein BRE01_28710 [Brevibacillus reuszeri]